MDKLKQLQEKLARAQETMKKVLDQAGPENDFSKVTEIAGTTQEKCAALRKMNDEQDAIVKEMESLRDIPAELAAERKRFEERNNIRPTVHPDTKGGQNPETKGGRIITLKEHFRTSGILRKENWRKEFTLPEGINLKTLFQTSAGWAPEDTRTGRVVEYPFQPPTVLDIIPIGRTDQSTVLYMQVTTRTNNAIEIKEGDSDAAMASSEAALVVGEQSAEVRKIMVYLPTTDEQLADEKQAGPFVDRTLREMIRERLSYQVVNGNGTAPNLSGILDQGTLQSVNKSDNAGDIVTDVLYRMMTKVRVNAFKQPTNFIIHPNDLMRIRLQKSNDGVYIWGHPSQAGPESIWGLPFIPTTDIAEYKALTGAFSTSLELVEREGIVILISNSHDTYFLKGKLAVKATVRAALPIYRPDAFCEGNLNS